MSSQIISEISNKMMVNNDHLSKHNELTTKIIVSEVSNHTSKLTSDIDILKCLVQQTLEDKKEREHREQVETLTRVIADRTGERQFMLEML